MNKLFNYLILGVFIIPLLLSCSGESGGKEIDDDVLDPNSSLNTAFDGKIFSIPSPIQTSLLIKSLDLPFNSSLMSPVDDLESFTTEYQQSLNLGILGTDLGYASLYNQNSYSVRYLAAVQKITEKLGLGAAFDKQFLIRFEKNLANQDSMLIVVSDAFKKSDYFLKNSDRKATSALILTGGWIESMYLASELNIQKPSVKIVERIGEQQLTLTSIIEILSEYNTGKMNDGLIQDLKDLQFYFDKIEFKYTYVEPKTDEANKTTTLLHSLEIKIDTDILNQISMKIRSIREKIIA
tara:strand:+ start:29365 stop:30249 length:885 start_codon:yes stop_codon:yes gene_type:complete